MGSRALVLVRVGKYSGGPLEVKRGSLAVVAVALAGAAAAYYLLREPSPEAALANNWSMLEQYCIDCHNDAEYTGDISFEGYSPEDVLEHAEQFEAAIRKLSINAMPPRDEPQPDPDLKADFLAALEGTLDAAWAENDSPVTL